MKKILLLFSVIAVSFSCAKKNNDLKTLWVNSYKKQCDAGAGKKMCLLTSDEKKLSSEIEWEFFYNSIKGFEYKPGYFQQIKVKETKLDAKKVPADASSISYELVEVMEEKRDERFSLNDIWAVEKIGDKVIGEETKRPRLEVNLSKMQIFGFDGCNNYAGKIEKFSADEITFVRIGSTKKMCSNIKLAQAYTQALQETKYYKKDKLSLYFFDKNDEKVLQFKKID
ncbi:DUF4377 domain-containing protein [Mesonia aquimarina]|uniref:DUF4377 domain-containing protein n=1 Tax=Mesonia aquimarina TaxID=1504967 RepID=UPI000EF58882|nr:DUF4377 domain-containing protein [Mesonia aquimarina]